MQGTSFYWYGIHFPPLLPWQDGEPLSWDVIVMSSGCVVCVWLYSRCGCCTARLNKIGLVKKQVNFVEQNVAEFDRKYQIDLRLGVAQV